MIKIRNLYLKYVKEYYALYKINLDVEEGETVALIGENESGKTSLLRVLAGLENFEKGEIFVNGINMLNINYAEDLEVGYVPGKPFLLENQSVEKNLQYVFSFRNIDQTFAQNKIIEQSKKFELAGDIKRKAKYLSLYKKMLLQLARVSLREIKLFLIDNIFDELMGEELESILMFVKKLISQKGVTSIIATTRPEIASFFGARSVKMQHGNIVE